MLFASLSLTNYGRICEHDVYMFLEFFKQQDSYQFYQNLITSDDVPRNYKSLTDQTDSIFYKAFSSDIKTMARIITLRKRVLGVEDTDTMKGLD